MKILVLLLCLLFVIGVSIYAFCEDRMIKLAGIDRNDLTDEEFAKIYIDDGVPIRTTSHALNKLFHHLDKNRENRFVEIQITEDQNEVKE